MTDDRIAELLGWPRGRANRDSSLMHRIRIVVAEAQAEQDGHIYRLREQIARDTAQIERMRAALVDVRPLIGNMEKMLREILHLAGQPRSADEAEAFARLHSARRMIDEALGENDDR